MALVRVLICVLGAVALQVPSVAQGGPSPEDSSPSECSPGVLQRARTEDAAQREEFGWPPLGYFEGLEAEKRALDAVERDHKAIHGPGSLAEAEVSTAGATANAGAAARRRTRRAARGRNGPLPFSSEAEYQDWLDLTGWLPPVVDVPPRPPQSPLTAVDGGDNGVDLLLAWGTPMLRVNVRSFVEGVGLGVSFEAFNEALADHAIAQQARAVEEAMAAASATERDRLRASAARRNNVHFKWQMRNDPVATFGSERATELRVLHHVLKSVVRAYIGTYWTTRGPPPPMQQLALELWSSVHTNASSHAWHDHIDAGVCGVYYAAAPAGAGAIEFADPRGHRHPFYGNDLRFVPRVGDVIIFPPWVLHRVAGSGGMAGATPRVSYSFNTGSLSRAMNNVHAEKRRPLRLRDGDEAAALNTEGWGLREDAPSEAAD